MDPRSFMNPLMGNRREQREVIIYLCIRREGEYSVCTMLLLRRAGCQIHSGSAMDIMYRSICSSLGEDHAFELSSAEGGSSVLEYLFTRGRTGTRQVFVA